MISHSSYLFDVDVGVGVGVRCCWCWCWWWYWCWNCYCCYCCCYCWQQQQQYASSSSSSSSSQKQPAAAVSVVGGGGCAAALDAVLVLFLVLALGYDKWKQLCCYIGKQTPRQTPGPDRRCTFFLPNRPSCKRAGSQCIQHTTLGCLMQLSLCYDVQGCAHTQHRNANNWDRTCCRLPNAAYK